MKIAIIVLENYQLHLLYLKAKFIFQYEPPQGANPCNIGNAYICVADDECGSNNSHLLSRGGAANGKNCHFVREGILSELVIFGDKLFANVAGPKEDAETLLIPPLERLKQAELTRKF